MCDNRQTLGSQQPQPAVIQGSQDVTVTPKWVSISPNKWRVWQGVVKTDKPLMAVFLPRTVKSNFFEFVIIVKMAATKVQLADHWCVSVNV